MAWALHKAPEIQRGVFRTHLAQEELTVIREMCEERVAPQGDGPQWR